MDGDSGSTAVAPGNHTVSETGAARHRPGQVRQVDRVQGWHDNGVASGAGAALADVPVNSNQTVICTITNTRQPGHDPGRQGPDPVHRPRQLRPQDRRPTVKAAASVTATQGSKRPSTRATTRSPRTAPARTDLAKYDEVDRVQAGAHGAWPRARRRSAGQTSPSTPTTTVSARSPTPVDTGTIEVVKDLIPTTDPGSFDLKIDGSTRQGATPATATHGPKRPSTPATTPSPRRRRHGTDLADYHKSIECKPSNDASRRSSPATREPADVPVDSGPDIVCTITNTRRQGTIQVVKDLIPTHRPGQVRPQDRRLDRSRRGVGDDGDTGSADVDTGNHTVAETGAGTHRPRQLRQVDRVQAGHDHGAPRAPAQPRQRARGLATRR